MEGSPAEGEARGGGVMARADRGGEGAGLAGWNDG